MNFLVVSAASLVAVAVVHTVTFLIGRRIGRYNVVDITWGVGFVVIAATFLASTVIAEAVLAILHR